MPQPKRPRSSGDRSISGLALAGRMARRSSVADIPWPSSRIRISGAPSECYAQIQALADANHVSSAWVIRHALLKFLDEQTGQLRLPLLEEERGRG